MDEVDGGVVASAADTQAHKSFLLFMGETMAMPLLIVNDHSGFYQTRFCFLYVLRSDEKSWTSIRYFENWKRNLY